MKTKTARDIVKKWLIENGYDGLVDCYNECACGICDFAHCEDIISSCEVAKRKNGKLQAVQFDEEGKS
jgi:hypothetical protein